MDAFRFLRLFRLCSLVAIVVLSVAAAPAAEVIFHITAPGYYALVGGKLVAVQVVEVSPAGPVVPPAPPVPTPDPTPVPSDLTKQVVDAVNKVPVTDKRHEVALKLGKIYEMMSGQTLPPAKSVEAVTAMINLALQSDSGLLSAVYGVVDSALGKCATEAAVSAVLKQAANAVNSTVPASGDQETAEKYKIDWDKFMTFIMDIFVKFILPYIIKGI